LGYLFGISCTGGGIETNANGDDETANVCTTFPKCASGNLGGDDDLNNG